MDKVFDNEMEFNYEIIYDLLKNDAIFFTNVKDEEKLRKAFLQLEHEKAIFVYIPKKMLGKMFMYYLNKEDDGSTIHSNVFVLKNKPNTNQE